DVVAVDVSLRVEEFHGRLVGFQLVAVYDPEKMELLGEPIYSDLHQRLVFFPTYWRLGVGGSGHTNSGVSGFTMGGNIESNAALGLFLANESVPLATLFFRLKGEPGTTAELRFSDDEWSLFGGGPCTRNGMF